MVLAYHLVFCAYGFWLPNDPRGSWSDFVWAWELRRFGTATKTRSRRSVANVLHDHNRRQRAKQALQHPPVSFDEAQMELIAAGFEDYARRGGLSILACSIMPEHVHMVIARHRLTIEKVANQLRSAATRQLHVAGRHPLTGRVDRRRRTPKPWAEGVWKVFLDHPEGIVRAIDYVEGNPEKEGRARQRWSFVVSYGGQGAAPLRCAAKRD